MIYVTGSLAFDFIMDFPGKFSDQIIPNKIHTLSLSFLVDTLREGFGGTAGNIAYTLSLFRNKVSIIASAGRDFKSYEKFLQKNLVNTQFINIIKSDFTARAYILTDKVDNQITGFYPGAVKYDKTLHLPTDAESNDFVIISPTDQNAIDNYLKECISKNISFMFDPGMQLPRLSKNTLKRGVDRAKLIIGNDYEIALLMKKLGLTKWNLKKDQIMITTLGEKGCIVQSNTKMIKIPAVKTRSAVDPTGAGDAFRAGFLTGFIHGFDLTTCGRMGNLSAVYTVEKYGTTSHKFSLSEFKKRYKQNYNHELRY